jgi:hypothetical protein
MIFSVGFIALAVMVEAWPIYAMTMRTLYRGKMTAPELSLIAPSLLIVLALTMTAVVLSLRLGLKNLERMKES